MLDRIINYSIHQRLFVVIGVVLFAALGIFSFQRLPIDAVPDITNVQVQVNTEAMGLSPLEVEQRITYPIETGFAGIPFLQNTRSLSRYGLSQVTVVFEDGTDIYFARQQISERLLGLKQKLPVNVEPLMGPIATGLGEIFMWSIEPDKNNAQNSQEPFTLTNLRTIQDWVVKPQLRNVKGVADVNSIGGYVKQFHVMPDTEKLISYGIGFRDVLDALARNNANAAGAYIEHSGNQFLIRAPGQFLTLEDIGETLVGVHHGVPIFIKNVAEVQLGKELRTGAATRDGREIVLGTVFMLKGENSRVVSKRVAKEMERINRTLPKGVVAKTLYDRTDLVEATLSTVRNNLQEGALLVILVLFLLLGNFRAALITAMVIPLSMLFAVTGMVQNKVSGNLLSLGAIDFGIIVDGAVIIVENCMRRLGEEQKRLGRLLIAEERHQIVREAAREVARPSIFGVLIIMMVYLPILTLSGVEGKMFQPMAFTVLAALTGAMLLSITFVPAMVAQFSSGKISEEPNRAIIGIQKMYTPVLQWALNHRHLTLLFAGLLVVVSLLVGNRLGTEFLPTLDEQDIAVHALRIPGTSLTQAVDMQDTLEKKISTFSEVNYVFSKIGTAEIATDPMPPSVADVFVIMKPRKQWDNPQKSKDQVVAELEALVANIPGNKYEFTQPIQMRFNELIAGVRSDVAVKVFGDDLDLMLESAQNVLQVLKTVPGATDARVEPVTGLPILTIDFDRTEMARLGLNISDVQDVIEIAIGGKSAGLVFEGDRRFELLVRLPGAERQDVDTLKRVPLAMPVLAKHVQEPKYSAIVQEGGHPQYLPLGLVTDFSMVRGPNQISRENGKRRIVVTANVRGRDLGGFVEEAQRKINAQVRLPAGYWIDWGGQFENLISASRRLWVVVPLVLLLIFILLFTTLGNVKDALLVYTGIPLALTGGVFFLWLRSIPFSISAAIGFIALSGIAVLNGLVMISYITSLRQSGMALDEAIIKGSLTRLRPVLMTALVASLGFLPMALATGTGAEVQRPLASVVIGGIISSTALTLWVLPALYKTFRRGV